MSLADSDWSVLAVWHLPKFLIDQSALSSDIRGVCPFEQQDSVYDVLLICSLD